MSENSLDMENIPLVEFLKFKPEDHFLIETGGFYHKVKKSLFRRRIFIFW